MTTLVHQALLTSGPAEMVAWLNTRRVRVGSRVTLKKSGDPDRLWTVRKMYGARPLDTLHTDWRVGGL